MSPNQQWDSQQKLLVWNLKNKKELEIAKSSYDVGCNPSSIIVSKAPGTAFNINGYSDNLLRQWMKQVYGVFLR